MLIHILFKRLLGDGDEPPPVASQSDSQEVPKVGSVRHSDLLCLESYVLCRRNPMGSGRLALVSLHGDNNIFNRSDNRN